MVWINLFAGQEQRHRCRERLCEHRGGSGAWEKWRSSSDIYPLPPVNRCRAGGGHTARAAHLHLRDDLDGWGGKACMQTYS